MIAATKSYIEKYFSDKRYAYHSLSHTLAVCEAVKVIAEKEEIKPKEIELVELAALFHDTGFAENPSEHEALSAQIAEKYLLEKGSLPEDVTVVKNLILATKVDFDPANKLQCIIKDADLAHLGQKCFNDNSLKLKQEKETFNGENILIEDWTRNNVKFLKSHEWHTQSAKKLFNKQKGKNLKKEKKKLKELNKEKKKSLKESTPEKGVETMYRVALRNHNQLSKIADNKANILLSITAIMLSLVISNLATKIDTNPQFLIPTILIISVNLVTMFFAILATRPKVSNATYSREAFLDNKVNILFFGNFNGMKLEEFEWGMNYLQTDRSLLYNSLSKDLYYLGKVLTKKYRYLRIAYSVFMGGLFVSALSFIWTIMK